MDSAQTKLYTAILITAFILGTVILYFVISMIRQQRKNMRLQRMNILAEINAIEKEQARMAADLHDELGPVLTVIKYEVDGVEARTAEDQELLKKASGHLDMAVGKIREIARNMMPSALTRNGLQAALQQVANHTSEFTPLHVTLAYDVQRAVDQEMSINIFRIIQEVIQNALKHAQAELMLVRIKEEQGKLHILCEDNGSGFDTEVQKSDGIGLRNIRTRIDLMGGNMQLTSQPGRGTQYIFDIPLPSYVQ
ncbi:MAG TPA: ATP-binding protein [Flavisolibacter sp.]